MMNFYLKLKTLKLAQDLDLKNLIKLPIYSVIGAEWEIKMCGSRGKKMVEWGKTGSLVTYERAN